MSQEDDESELENSIIENLDGDYSAMDIVLAHKKIIERDIWSLGYKLSERKELVEKINKYIQNECEHEFVIDFVDDMNNYHKGSQKIIYCNKCEFVKPFNTSNKCEIIKKGN